MPIRAPRLVASAASGGSQARRLVGRFKFEDNSVIKHTHNLDGESSVWHDGSLASCPDSTWTEILFEDKPARFYHGMSVTLPPDTTNRFRRIVDAPAII